MSAARIPVLAMLVISLGLASVATVSAQRRGRRGSVRVRVVDVAAGRAYITPGAEAGVRRGVAVTLERRRYRVIAATASYAVVELGRRRLSVGDRGRAAAQRQGEEEETGDRLPTPPPLSEYRGQWPRPGLPATEQTPEPVPLGRIVDSSRVRATLSARGSSLIPFGEGRAAISSGALRGRVSAQPFRELPLSLDADVAVQAWLASDLGGRAGNGSRPLLRVRQLQLTYGDPEGFYGGLGRLRYAASSLGMLDGVRAQVALMQGLSLAAFGGFVPDPASGGPALDASRFGIELTYRDLDSALRPLATLVGHGSVFEGELDERRVSASVQMFPGDGQVGAHAELSAMDSSNPFGQAAVKLTSASVDGSYRAGVLEVGARADMRRPERSRWLSSRLPREWLCMAAIDSGGDSVEGDCANDTRLTGAAHAGLLLGDIAVRGGATVARTYHGQEQIDGPSQLGGYLSLRLARLFDVGRAGVSFWASSGTLLTSYAARLSAGASLYDDRVDVDVHYSPSLSLYEADIARWTEHLLGTTVRVAAGEQVELSVSADAMISRDVDALLLQTAVVYRPGL